MNEKLFLIVNQLAGKHYILDVLGISLAKGMPYLFILIEIYLYFIKNKKNEAIFAFYSVLISLCISFCISLFYFHNRPFMDNLGTLLILHKPETSFPSDHTTFLFAIGFSFMFFKVKFWKIILFLSFLGGISRIYVGVHYPFDILAGIIIGFFGAMIIYFFKNYLYHLNGIIINIEKKYLGKIYERNG